MTSRKREQLLSTAVDLFYRGVTTPPASTASWPNPGWRR